MYFYPRSPCGERPSQGADFGHKMNFYPRSPCGERPLTDDVSTGGEIFLSTLSLRRATLAGMSDKLIGSVFLSTLSLRRATPRGGSCYLDNIISIHALLAESDGLYDTYAKVLRVFLSTLSLRRATVLPDPCGPQNTNFYPRSPCGERLNSAYGALDGASISIHALLAESDRLAPCSRHYSMDFYPRSPCGERLIHPCSCNAKPDFYPRSPCGERPPRGRVLLS